jgi:hypothetical protein
VLVRLKNGRTMPVLARYSDGSYLSTLGSLRVRVVEAEITIRPAAPSTAPATRRPSTSSSASRLDHIPRSLTERPWGLPCSTHQPWAASTSSHSRREPYWRTGHRL